MDTTMGRALGLWALGIPAFIIVLLAIFTDIVFASAGTHPLGAAANGRNPLLPSLEVSCWRINTLSPSPAAPLRDFVVPDVIIAYT
jgi:hypothetical protein